jgi:hypothetical protein
MAIYQFCPPEAVPARTLAAKNHCCRNRCIHCPYGFTLKTFGLNFVTITDKYREVANKITNNSMDLENYTLDDYKIVTLKGFYVAVIRVDHMFVKEFYLLPDFSDQGLSKEVVESYYFC